RRLGQALWMMVDQPVYRDELLWARGLLGPDGDQILWDALAEVGALMHPDSRLEPGPVAQLLCALWGVRSTNEEPARLVWTLPGRLNLPRLEDSYVRAA